LAARGIDLKKYQGKYRQVPVKPTPWFQKGCKKVTAEYTLQKDGTMKVVNKCDDRKIEGVAKPISDDNRKLSVDFGFPYPSGEYNIKKVDKDYNNVVVEGGDGTVWKLKRQSMAGFQIFNKKGSATLYHAQSIAEQDGHDWENLPLHDKLVYMDIADNENYMGERRQSMAYIGTYGAADLPVIGADAVGIAGAATVGLIPLAVGAGVIYGGARYSKKQYDKYKKRKRKKYRLASKEDEQI
jgi:apolipoprotein D and lipocalin family protein